MARARVAHRDANPMRPLDAQFAFRSVEYPLHKPQHVRGAEDYSEVATAAQRWLTPVKVLERIRNSPTNPFSIGSPIMASDAITKMVASRGTRFASPPYEAI